MDILKVLSVFYKDSAWTTVGEGYDGLNWDESNSLPKPTEEELQDQWDNHLSEMENFEVRARRQKEILLTWPIEKQFEAITEFHMDRPEKMNELIDFIQEIKDKYPKSTS